MHDADSIYVNANVITVDAHDRRAEAFAVRDGRFAVVGANADMRDWRGPQTTVVDVRGQTIIPGLIDAHNHLLSTGKVLRAVPLFGTRSLAEVQDRLRERAAMTPR